MQFAVPQELGAILGTALVVVVGALFRYLAKILSELRPNSGSSLKDAIDRIEEKLEFHSASHQFMGDLSGHAVFWTDAEGHNILVNRAYLDYLGYSLEDLLGRRWETIIHPDDLGPYRTAFELCLATGSRFRYNVRIRSRKVNDYIEATVSADPVFRQKKMVGCVGGWRPKALEP